MKDRIKQWASKRDSKLFRKICTDERIVYRKPPHAKWKEIKP